MITDERISDRHLREVDGLAPAADRRAVTVTVVADPAWAAAPAGQHLLVCLVNLLARLTETVTHIRLVVPSVPVAVRLPYGPSPGDLAAALAAMVPWAVGDDVSVEFTTAPGNDDLVLCLGRPTGQAMLCALADGWRCWVGDPAHFPRDSRVSTSTTPLGPYLAASFLAGEVFKRARGVTRGGSIHSLGYSLWTGTVGEWSFLEAGPELAGRDLPPFYLVGVGAVGQGLAQILGAAAFARGCVVAIDDDRHDKTNLNRCFLAGSADVGDPKMNAVVRYLNGTLVQCPPHVGTLIDYASKAKPSINAELARAESECRYDIIVSCVDKGKSRQDIQGLRPRLIIGGSTTGLTAKTNVYDFAPGTPCLGCHNPPEKDAERLREFERVLRAMSHDERIAYLRDRGVDPRPILQYLADGKCGSAGENMLRDMATGSPREFSVSFVSMGAAVLLAARLFSRVLFGGPDADRARMTSIAFLRGSVLDTALAVDATCGRHGAND
ncbi:MAG: hypothetical protein QOJ15_1052 [Bradyrhizobium sp.]|nr:hypothetical protein [Bradyrhizobium sp.]